MQTGMNVAYEVDGAVDVGLADEVSSLKRKPLDRHPSDVEVVITLLESKVS